jgi:tetraacyldisaccharide 4'-kinase
LYFKNYFNTWIEQYLFFPNILQKLISICLFPLTIIYCIVVAFKRSAANPRDFGINVVSVGNLVIGGTGKTPVIITLAKKEKKPAIILRGYGRKSKGLYIVSNGKDILHDVETSGDEAMLYALALEHACVIVSENRELAILKAKELSCSMVFLDDGYRHHNIKKFDILLRPKIEPTNLFCLPSGGYKETKMMYSFVPVVLQDGKDFIRKVSYSQFSNELLKLPNNCLLLTAISKPQRLLEYLPKDIKTITFKDHYEFTQNDIDKILNDYPNFSIITTQKDMVKLRKFNIKSIIEMHLEIDIVKEIEYKF